MQIYLESTEQTEQFGARLFNELTGKTLIFLQGDLGVGKTTLVRGFLRSAGYEGVVKSPTYNVVEEYTIDSLKVFHFDLYRLTDPEELEWIGIRDYFDQEAVCFIEWPDKGEGYLPLPDKTIRLLVKDSGRELIID